LCLDSYINNAVILSVPNNKLNNFTRYMILRCDWLTMKCMLQSHTVVTSDKVYCMMATIRSNGQTDDESC